MIDSTMPPNMPPPGRRVCVVGSGWRFTSGLSYYTCRLASALTTHGQVSAVLLRGLIPRRFYPGRERVGIPVHRIDYPSDMPLYDGIDWFWLPSIFGAIRFIRRQRPQVLILEWWTGAVLHTFVLLVIVARRLGARVIVEFHEVQDTGEARTRFARSYALTVGSWILRRVHGFVVHSQHDLIAVRQRFPVAGLPSEIIRHGPFDHYVHEDYARPTASRPETIVLFFGTIRPYKGLEVLVRAFESLSAEEAAELRLLIVGETWENWTEPLKLVAESRHKERITVVNRYVHDEEVATFFNEADAVVLPYLRSSASGPLHITMAYGLPVVLSDVGGLRDGAEGYDGVIWVPPSDVAAVAEALRKLPSRRGQRYPDPRSWDQTSKAFAQLIDRIELGS